MKRKLSLGMALIGATKTIILDEPTSGLDVESREQMWELIRTLKEGRSIIMSTQHIEEADELADRVCIMSHGKIIGLDTPARSPRLIDIRRWPVFSEFWDDSAGALMGLRPPSFG